MKRLLFLASAMAIGTLTLVPAAAQDADEDRVNTLVVYGDDPCPQSTAEEITVCARMDEGERYRIPPRLRESIDPANEAWASRVRSLEAVGDFGPMSCTPIGSGGELGCTAQMIEAAFAERAQGSDVRFSQLIEEARQERLATIDEEAAATQARVEQAEREYMERRRAEEGEDAAPPPADDGQPRVVDPERLVPAP